MSTDEPAPPAANLRPGRRARASSEVRRRQVLNAARRLFAEHGFHGTSTRDLSRASDLNDALLYRHFAGKEDILLALVDEAIEVFDGLPSPPPGLQVPLADLLVLAGTAFLDAATANRDLLTILIKEHGTIPDDRRFVAFVDRAARQLGEVIDTMDPPAPGDDPPEGLPGRGYLTARAFFGALLSFVLLQKVLGLDDLHPVDEAVYLHHLARLVAPPA